MLISPKTAIDNGWIKFPEWMSEEQRNKCIQPNACDVTADKLYCISPHCDAFLSEDGKQFHNLIEEFPDADGFWVLEPNQVYDVMSDFYITVPEKVAGEFVIRSTLNRCGLALNTGIYDSGFKGNAGMTIYNRAQGKFRLKPHTRVCQIKFTVSDSSGTYAGGYNTKHGEHWAAPRLVY